MSGTTPGPGSMLHVRPVAIAPGLAPGPSKTDDSPSTISDPRSPSVQTPPAPAPMSFNCQLCVRRKVKCDRSTPKCSSCLKAKQQCVYQPPPPPRRRKRKHDDSDENVHEQDVLGRLAKYERILREHGLLPAQDAFSPAPGIKETSQTLQSPTWTTDAADVKPGKLLLSDGKTRYIDSSLWLGASADEMNELAEHADTDQRTQIGTCTSGEDPVSACLLGFSQNLLGLHPGYEDAMKLWSAHTRNVEPICRILHIPSTTRLFERLSRRPVEATKGEECLMFAVYHFATLSMTDEDCLRIFGQPRASLLSKYQHALRQALVNASLLKTTEMCVMQAFVLFLVSVRNYMDPHSFWILTGVAVRIAQRMGLHRDGESLGLPPFEIQMRRRLFWQLVPLDGQAGQHSGTGISIPPGTWDTKKPLNVDDDKIWPGMTQQPEEQKGATDLIFSLAKGELTAFYCRIGLNMKKNGPAVQLKENTENELLINEIEDLLESKYLRYCDIVNPLHYLTLVMSRCAIRVVRLRNRVSPLKIKDISDAERKELCELSYKIIDSDSALYNNLALRNFHWHIKAFFLWDAMICILASLSKPAFFSVEERDENWVKLEELYENHEEIIEARGPLHVSVGRMTLEAWAENPPTGSTPEPQFISALRARRDWAKEAAASRAPKEVEDALDPVEYAGDEMSWVDNTGLNLDADFNFNFGNWMFFDQAFQRN